MIFVTGASGNVGRLVLQRLQQLAQPVRVGIYSHHANLTDTGVESVRFDFHDPSTFHAAVSECAGVFLMRPPAISNTRKTLNIFLDVARQHGVSQVVFISVAGAGSNPLVPHHAVEQHLRAGPGGWTILRPGFFAQNLADAYRGDIRGVSANTRHIYVPAGRARVAFIDALDIAEIAVLALLEPSKHRGKTYTLTGPEALSFAELAQIVTQEIGQLVRYQPASIGGYLWHLRKLRLPIAQILVQTILHVGLRFGQSARVTNVTADLLGHPAATLREYVHRHRELWL